MLPVWFLTLNDAPDPPDGPSPPHSNLWHVRIHRGTFRSCFQPSFWLSGCSVPCRPSSRVPSASQGAVHLHFGGGNAKRQVRGPDTPDGEIQAGFCVQGSSLPSAPTPPLLGMSPAIGARGPVSFPLLFLCTGEKRRLTCCSQMLPMIGLTSPRVSSSLSHSSAPHAFVSLYTRLSMPFP